MSDRKITWIIHQLSSVTDYVKCVRADYANGYISESQFEDRLEHVANTLQSIRDAMRQL